MHIVSLFIFIIYRQKFIVEDKFNYCRKLSFFLQIIFLLFLIASCSSIAPSILGVDVCENCITPFCLVFFYQPVLGYPFIILIFSKET
ncbi:MAG: hypothetical protein A2X77_00965 [Gammaproteobacteria bacterium GWE2_42_36]|nr:MAG: hypothetical protein A2X77_00965 [Gammaproteobacteria bacterium GWE2_42_36]